MQVIWGVIIAVRAVWAIVRVHVHYDIAPSNQAKKEYNDDDKHNRPYNGKDNGYR